MIAACCAVTARAAAQGVEAMAWQQPIAGEVASGLLYRVAIPAEVFDGCRAFPADIRIVDEQHAVWPFFLWSPPQHDTLQPVFATLGRRTGGGAGKIVAQEIVIRVDERTGRLRHNQVSVLTAGNNFLRRVEVLGSEDGQTWRELGSGHLVDQMRESHVSKRLVTYADATVPRLMLRIHPTRGSAAEVIEVLDAQVSWRESAPDVLLRTALDPILLPDAEGRDHVVTAAYDTGAQGRPLERLTVRLAADGDFVFPVKVSGRNAVDASWRWVADGGVFRLEGEENADINLNSAGYRQIKVEVYHQGYRAPAIRGAEAWSLPQFIVFESKGGRLPVLHYGADRMPLPRYDLQRRTSESDITNAPALVLGKARGNPLRVATGLSAYLRTMAWVAAVLAAAAILFVALRSARARF